MEEEKELDDHIRRCLKELPLEEIPTDFTTKVMSAVKAEKKYGVKPPITPLISGFSWIVIFSISAVLMILGYNSEFDGYVFGRLLGFFDRNTYSIMQFENISVISNTQIITYSSIALGCFVCIQVLLLKKSWSGRQVIY